MAQFDVYKNQNASTSTVYPLLLDVQHAVLDTLTTRIVIPLGITDKEQVKHMEVLAPLVELYQYEDCPILLDHWQRSGRTLSQRWISHLPVFNQDARLPHVKYLFIYS